MTFRLESHIPMPEHPANWDILGRDTLWQTNVQTNAGYALKTFHIYAVTAEKKGNLFPYLMPIVSKTAPTSP